MQFVHIADTHLGLSAFNRLDPDTGTNLRERLVYDNFLASVDRLIALKPGAVVHAGDLFHQVKPKTRAYTVVLEALNRLHESGIPLVAIAGNHSMVKTRHTTSPFEVLEYHAADIHAAYRYAYRRVEIDDVCFHLIPNMLQAADYRRAFEEIEFSRSSANVLVVHGLASILSDKRLHSVAEHEIDSTMLSDRFDYIALGHFHGQVQVADNTWYSGSLEYCNYGEIGDRKGGLLVDPTSRRVKHLPLPHTPMTDLGTIVCDGRSVVEIGREIEGRVQRLEDSLLMCQITLDRIPRGTLREIDPRVLQEARARVLDLRLRAVLPDESASRFETQDLVGIDYLQEFEKYLRRQPFPPARMDYMLRKGREVLERAIARAREEEHASP